LVIGPTVFDRDVLPVGVAGLLQSAAKGAQTVRILAGRLAAEEPDDRLVLRLPRRRAA